jgi:hypothetical protein
LLPNGINLASSTGVLSGTPGGSDGTYTFTVKATDASSAVATTVFSLALTGTTVTTVRLPDVPLSTPYSQPLTVGSGTGPYTWSIVSGALPTGITLTAASGLLSGTPTVVGLFPITFRATDANGATGDKALNLAVTNFGSGIRIPVRIN